eukprot:GHVH01004949.1.p1 GENE.GHVH01004949.1~~GHVH01004949.1.p1  ORF type:complete len:115 (+),score=15.59 GHVH01004949.1:30-374(+)
MKDHCLSEQQEDYRVDVRRIYELTRHFGRSSDSLLSCLFLLRKLKSVNQDELFLSDGAKLGWSKGLVAGVVFDLVTIQSTAADRVRHIGDHVPLAIATFDSVPSLETELDYFMH